MSDATTRDVVVVGGGQSGLAAGYFLRRSGLDFEILDAGDRPGGAWPDAWDSLRLFSPAETSSLPGWPMPSSEGGYPNRDHVVDYLTRYEQRYGLPVRRPVRARAVQRAGERLVVRTDAGTWTASAVISATGGASRPFVPDYPGRQSFRGRQIHSSAYRRPGDFAGHRILLVGGGNSGAQILAELSLVAEVTWVTNEAPRFLPDELHGKALFDSATERVRAQVGGRTQDPPRGGLGDIVMVPSVLEARDRGALHAVRPFARFEPEGVVWPDGSRSQVDAVIWCTGFRPALDHLEPLGVLAADGSIAVVNGRSAREPRLWLLGYGDWTGAASATLAGITRSARDAVRDMQQFLTQGRT